MNVLRPQRADLVAVASGLLGAPESYVSGCATADTLRALLDAVGEGSAWAWETLATRGLLPLAWVDDDARWFYCDACQPHPSGPRLDPLCGDAHASRVPPSVSACVAIASDLPGVARAEALARETAARLAPWGAPPATRVVWRFVDPKRWRPSSVLPLEAAERETLPPDAPIPLLRFFDGTWVRCAYDDHAAAHRRWARRPKELPAHADPFAPLVDLWHAGYALDALTETAIVLACPVIGSEP